MKAYLLVFDPSQVQLETMTALVDRIDEIENWYAFFGNTICIASRHDARALSRSLRAVAPKQRFLITEVDAGNKAGWMPRSIWDFLNKPEPALSTAAE